MRHNKAEDLTVLHLIILYRAPLKGNPKREGHQHYPRLPVPVQEGTVRWHPEEQPVLEGTEPGGLQQQEQHHESRYRHGSH